MGIRLQRTKPRHWLLSLAYRLNRLLPLSAKQKLNLYLDLEWITGRLAHETSYRVLARENHPFARSRRTFLLSRINPADRVLELGCGRGENAYLASERAAHAVGIDQDPASIADAKRLHVRSNLEFHLGDAREYLRRAPKFDVLILSHILEHLDNPEEFLRELAPKFDRVYIEVPDFEGPPLNALRLLQKRSLIYSDADHVSEFDREEVRMMLGRSSLNILEEEFQGDAMRWWCAKA